MQVLVLGGSGFIGKRLTHRLLQKGKLSLNGQDTREIKRLVVFDKHGTDQSSRDSRLEIVTGDITDHHTIEKVFQPSYDAIFHLAAIVSGEAERDFDLGMSVNLEASMHILDLCRHQDVKPLMVFASSCAVFGGNVTNDIIRDDTHTTPQSSYGTQKAIIELLINDYSRRGFIDGRVLRLPTIIVRPGKPNAANSSFASSIIREPLHGRSTICPVSDETMIWILSPEAATFNFVHAAGLNSEFLGDNRIVTLPGLKTSVGEIKERLEELKGKDTIELINSRIDPDVDRMIQTWPIDFDTARALKLGFVNDNSISDVIELFITEELKR